MQQFNIGFEIASEGELKILSSLKVRPERIISSNPVKSHKFLKMTSAYGCNTLRMTHMKRWKSLHVLRLAVRFT
jgi:diaminopimelate decarboxylase